MGSENGDTRVRRDEGRRYTRTRGNEQMRRMWAALFSAIGAFSYAAAAAEAPAGQTAGVLLGLRWSEAAPDEGYFASVVHYGTFSLVADGREARLDGRLPFLLLPTAQGPWRFDDRHGCWIDDEMLIGERRDVPFGGPLGAPARVEPLGDCKATAADLEKRRAVVPGEKRLPVGDYVDPVCSDTALEIDHAGRELVALSFRGATMCGVHPDGWFWYRVVPLASWRSEEKLALAHVFDPGTKVAFDLAAAAALEADEKTSCVIDGVDSDWTLIHRRGRWMIHGAVWLARVCGFMSEFDMPTAVPRAIGGEQMTEAEWRALRAALPPAPGKPSDPDFEPYDAVVSPDHGVAFAVGEGEILAYRRAGDAWKGPLARWPAPRDAQVVMQEWETGAAVSGQAAELRRLIEEPPPEPAPDPSLARD